ncbi:MAG: preprotein translocase subunit SecY [Clostridiales bacterium]|jgi:preprotein translocase subunit SecY|nr:preprotein translocase subunit SecY [Clostridiales bacterium]
MMFKVFANAWKVPDIRKKLFYAFLIVAIYRLACHIPLPFMNLNALQQYKLGENTNTFYAILIGGGIGTVAKMGIGPYITSSIIMQLLTVAIPPLEQLQKEGEEGRKKINQITRIVAVALSVIQGIGEVYSIHTLFSYQNILVYITAVVSMVTGTIIIMWLSELLTEKAIGNGSSFIIFANILSGLPAGVRYMYMSIDLANWVSIAKVAAVLVIFVALVAFVIYIQDGERRVPITYSKKMVGRQMYGGSSSFIPIKVNIAGVMSIIFAISLLQFPQVLNGFFNNPTLENIVNILNISEPVGALLYVFLIFCFTFFYTSFAINPIEIAENLKKNGGVIPAIRPGKPTSDFIQTSIDRLSWIGALFYAIIAMIPVIVGWTLQMELGVGGTTLLIVTGVALEIMKQLESQLLMRHYKGFLEQ